MCNQVLRTCTLQHNRLSTSNKFWQTFLVEICFFFFYISLTLCAISGCSGTRMGTGEPVIEEKAISSSPPVALLTQLSWKMVLWDVVWYNNFSLANIFVLALLLKNVKSLIRTLLNSSLLLEWLHFQRELWHRLAYRCPLTKQGIFVAQFSSSYLKSNYERQCLLWLWQVINGQKLFQRFDDCAWSKK